MRKTLLLSIALAAPPLLLWLPGVLELLGGSGGYRMMVMWGLPIYAGSAAALFVPGRPAHPWSDGLRPAGLGGGWPRLAVSSLAALVIDYAYLGIGQATGWATFTFGDQGLMGHPAATALWALPLCLALGVLGWERALRGTLLVSWSERLPRGAAAAISCVVGLALAAPSILTGPRFPDPGYAVSAFVAAACREASFTLLFLSGGGLLAAGLYRGLLFYLDAFLVSDWYGVYFPAVNVASSEPRFYVVRGATAVLSLAALALGLARGTRRAGWPAPALPERARAGEAGSAP
jgi:hypothetical protein